MDSNYISYYSLSVESFKKYINFNYSINTFGLNSVAKRKFGDICTF